MAASVIPPPIIQSTYASSPPHAVTQSVVVEKPSPLQDRQSELEADLQFLLDAQAEGLVRGLEGGLPDDQTSTGSTTPTAQSVRSASARRTSRPMRKKPGLRSARKGIYNAILALSTVKDEELSGIDDEIQEKDQALEQISEWEKKKQGLQDAAKSVDSNEETVRVQRLQQEADDLQEEINAVELQLAEMNSQHRKLMRQISSAENTVQAKMASYTSSLHLLEEDVQKFLSLKRSEGSNRPTSQDGKTSMWQLPPKRRTLEMATQQFNEERDSIMQQRQSIEHEKSALDDGAAMWKDVVAQCTDFERKLRADMSKQSPTEVMPLQDRLNDMNDLIQVLESKLEYAKERNWNLLIAAIGAELDALQRGKGMLQSSLGLAEHPPDDLLDAKASSSGDDPLLGGGEEIHELDKSFETARRRLSNESESDDPDPELLFSRHDPDTD